MPLCWFPFRLCVPVRVSEFGIILGKCTAFHKINSPKFPVYFWYKSKGQKLTFWLSKISYFYVECFKNVPEFLEICQKCWKFLDFWHISKNSGTFGIGFNVVFLSKVRIIFKRFLTVKESPKSPKYRESWNAKYFWQMHCLSFHRQLWTTQHKYSQTLL